MEPCISPPAEPIYRPNDVVWCKLSPLMWPGVVQDVDQLDPDVLGGLKKAPLAVVKYLPADDEDDRNYAFPRTYDEIYHYNCKKKMEFIKLGRKRFYQHRKEKNTSFFPAALSEAEVLTGGDPNMVTKMFPDKDPDVENRSPRKKTLLTMNCESPQSNIFTLYFGNNRKPPPLDDDDPPEDNPEPPGLTCHVCGYTTQSMTMLMIHHRFKKHSDFSRRNSSVPIPIAPKRSRQEIIALHASKKKKKVKKPAVKATSTPVPKSRSSVSKRLEVSQECVDLLRDWETEEMDDNSNSMAVDNDTAVESLNRTEVEEIEPTGAAPIQKLSSCFDFNDEESSEPDLQKFKFGQRLPRIDKSKEDKKKSSPDVTDFDNFLNEVSVSEIPSVPVVKHSDLKKSPSKGAIMPDEPVANSDHHVGNGAEINEQSTENSGENFLADGPLQSKKRKDTSKVEGTEDGSAKKKTKIGNDDIPSKNSHSDLENNSSCEIEKTTEILGQHNRMTRSSKESFKKSETSTDLETHDLSTNAAMSTPQKTPTSKIALQKNEFLEVSKLMPSKIDKEEVSHGTQEEVDKPPRKSKRTHNIQTTEHLNKQAESTTNIEPLEGHSKQNVLDQKEETEKPLSFTTHLVKRLSARLNSPAKLKGKQSAIDEKSTLNDIPKEAVGVNKSRRFSDRSLSLDLKPEKTDTEFVEDMGKEKKTPRGRKKHENVKDITPECREKLDDVKDITPESREKLDNLKDKTLTRSGKQIENSHSKLSKTPHEIEEKVVEKTTKRTIRRSSQEVQATELTETVSDLQTDRNKTTRKSQSHKDKNEDMRKDAISNLNESAGGEKEAKESSIKKHEATCNKNIVDDMDTTAESMADANSTGDRQKCRSSKRLSRLEQNKTIIKQDQHAPDASKKGRKSTTDAFELPDQRSSKTPSKDQKKKSDKPRVDHEEDKRQSDLSESNYIADNSGDIVYHRSSFGRKSKERTVDVQNEGKDSNTESSKQIEKEDSSTLEKEVHVQTKRTRSSKASKGLKEVNELLIEDCETLTDTEKSLANASVENRVLSDTSQPNMEEQPSIENEKDTQKTKEDKLKSTVFPTVDSSKEPVKSDQCSQLISSDLITPSPRKRGRQSSKKIINETDNKLPSSDCLSSKTIQIDNKPYCGVDPKKNVSTRRSSRRSSFNDDKSPPLDDSKMITDEKVIDKNESPTSDVKSSKETQDKTEKETDVAINRSDKKIETSSSPDIPETVDDQKTTRATRSSHGIRATEPAKTVSDLQKLKCKTPKKSQPAKESIEDVDKGPNVNAKLDKEEAKVSSSTEKVKRTSKKAAKIDQDIITEEPTTADATKDAVVPLEETDNLSEKQKCRSSKRLSGQEQRVPKSEEQSSIDKKKLNKEKSTPSHKTSNPQHDIITRATVEVLKETDSEVDTQKYKGSKTEHPISESKKIIKGEQRNNESNELLKEGPSNAFIASIVTSETDQSTIEPLERPDGGDSKKCRSSKRLSLHDHQLSASNKSRKLEHGNTDQHSHDKETSKSQQIIDMHSEGKKNKCIEDERTKTDQKSNNRHSKSSKSISDAVEVSARHPLKTPSKEHKKKSDILEYEKEVNVKQSDLLRKDKEGRIKHEKNDKSHKSNEVLSKETLHNTATVVESGKSLEKGELTNAQPLEDGSETKKKYSRSSSSRRSGERHVDKRSAYKDQDHKVEASIPIEKSDLILASPQTLEKEQEIQAKPHRSSMDSELTKEELFDDDKCQIKRSRSSSRQRSSKLTHKETSQPDKSDLVTSMDTELTKEERFENDSPQIKRSRSSSRQRSSKLTDKEKLQPDKVDLVTSDGPLEKSVLIDATPHKSKPQSSRSRQEKLKTEEKTPMKKEKHRQSKFVSEDQLKPSTPSKSRASKTDEIKKSNKSTKEVELTSEMSPRSSSKRACDFDLLMVPLEKSDLTHPTPSKLKRDSKDQLIPSTSSKSRSPQKVKLDLKKQEIDSPDVKIDRTKSSKSSIDVPHDDRHVQPVTVIEEAHSPNKKSTSETEVSDIPERHSKGHQSHGGKLGVDPQQNTSDFQLVKEASPSKNTARHRSESKLDTNKSTAAISHHDDKQCLQPPVKQSNEKSIMETDNKLPSPELLSPAAEVEIGPNRFDPTKACPTIPSFALNKSTPLKDELTMGYDDLNLQISPLQHTEADVEFSKVPNLPSHSPTIASLSWDTHTESSTKEPQLISPTGSKEARSSPHKTDPTVDPIRSSTMKTFHGAIKSTENVPGSDKQNEMHKENQGSRFLIDMSKTPKKDIIKDTSTELFARLQETLTRSDLPKIVVSHPEFSMEKPLSASPPLSESKIEPHSIFSQLKKGVSQSQAAPDVIKTVPSKNIAADNKPFDSSKISSPSFKISPLKKGFTSSAKRPEVASIFKESLTDVKRPLLNELFQLSPENTTLKQETDETIDFKSNETTENPEATIEQTLSSTKTSRWDNPYPIKKGEIRAATPTNLPISKPSNSPGKVKVEIVTGLGKFCVKSQPIKSELGKSTGHLDQQDKIISESTQKSASVGDDDLAAMHAEILSYADGKNVYPTPPNSQFENYLVKATADTSDRTVVGQLTRQVPKPETNIYSPIMEHQIPLDIREIPLPDSPVSRSIPSQIQPAAPDDKARREATLLTSVIKDEDSVSSSANILTQQDSFNAQSRVRLPPIESLNLANRKTPLKDIPVDQGHQFNPAPAAGVEVVSAQFIGNGKTSQIGLLDSMDLELDINSMPIVIGDDFLTEDGCLPPYSDDSAPGESLCPAENNNVPTAIAPTSQAVPPVVSTESHSGAIDTQQKKYKVYEAQRCRQFFIEFTCDESRFPGYETWSPEFYNLNNNEKATNEQTTSAILKESKTATSKHITPTTIKMISNVTKGSFPTVKLMPSGRIVSAMTGIGKSKLATSLSSQQIPKVGIIGRSISKNALPTAKKPGIISKGHLSGSSKRATIFIQPSNPRVLPSSSRNLMAGQDILAEAIASTDILPSDSMPTAEIIMESNLNRSNRLVIARSVSADRLSTSTTCSSDADSTIVNKSITDR